MKKYQSIFNNSHTITNDFNKELFLSSLKAQLESQAFEKCIKNEADGLKITINIEVLTEERDKKMTKRKEIEKEFKKIKLIKFSKFPRT